MLDIPAGPSRAAVAGLWLLTIALAVQTTLGAWQIGVPSDRLPHVDAAGHGVHGVKMAHAIARGDLPRFIQLIDERDEWPPLWALAEVPVFLAFGDDYSVARGFVAILRGIGVMALFALGLALPGARGLVAGAAGAGLYAMSPFAQVMATIVMLEVPAVILLAVLSIFYVRYCRWERPFDATMTAVLTTVLFFHKFGYATLWMASVALNELGRAIPSPQKLRAHGVPLLTKRLFWFTAVPLAVWFAVPGHFRAFVGYMGGIENRDRTPFDHLLFYPTTFSELYSNPAWVGWPILIIAALSLRWIPRMPPAERILPLSLAATLVIATSHGFKGWRHIFTIAPIIWLCFGWVVGHVIARFDRSRRQWFAYVGAALMLSVALGKGVEANRVLDMREMWSSPPQTREVLEGISEVHTASDGTALTGAWWDLSNQLVEWHLILTKREDDTGKSLPGTRPVNPDWYGVGRGAAAVPRLAADRQVERVMVLELPRGAPVYNEVVEAENPLLPEFKAAMDGSPDFVLEETRRYPATGYELHVYARASVDSLP